MDEGNVENNGNKTDNNGFFRTKNHDNHIGEETLLSATALKDEN